MVGSGHEWGRLERAETQTASDSSAMSSVPPRDQASRCATTRHALDPGHDSGEVTRPRA